MLEKIFADRPQMILAWVLLIGSLIGWPISMVWLAPEEPPFVLSLSWLAITLTALDVLKTTYATREIKEGQDKDG